MLNGMQFLCRTKLLLHRFWRKYLGFRKQMVWTTLCYETSENGGWLPTIQECIVFTVYLCKQVYLLLTSSQLSPCENGATSDMKSTSEIYYRCPSQLSLWFERFLEVAWASHWYICGLLWYIRGSIQGHIVSIHHTICACLGWPGRCSSYV
jgi:hypothetical protein